MENQVIKGILLEENNLVAQEQARKICPYCKRPLGFNVELAAVEVGSNWEVSHNDCYLGVWR